MSDNSKGSIISGVVRISQIMETLAIFLRRALD